MRARFSLAALAVCCLGATALAAPAPAREITYCEQTCSYRYQNCIASGIHELQCERNWEECMVKCEMSGGS